MEVIVIPTGELEENCYVVYDTQHQEVLLVDPGDDADTIAAMIRALGAKVEAILLTHSHYDHIGAVDQLAEEFHCGVYLHEREIQASPASSIASPLPVLTLKTPLVPVRPEMKLGCFDVKAIFAPGHSQGSTMYLIGDNLFTGDVLFQGSIGRTDLPGGNADEMIQSLHLLASLPGNYTVYPGHGPASTLNYEKQHNPYLAFLGM